MVKNNRYKAIREDLSTVLEAINEGDIRDAKAIIRDIQEDLLVWELEV